MQDHKFMKPTIGIIRLERRNLSFILDSIWHSKWCLENIKQEQPTSKILQFVHRSLTWWLSLAFTWIYFIDGIVVGLTSLSADNGKLNILKLKTDWSNELINWLIVLIILLRMHWAKLTILVIINQTSLIHTWLVRGLTSRMACFYCLHLVLSVRLHCADLQFVWHMWCVGVGSGAPPRVDADGPCFRVGSLMQDNQ